MKVIRLAAALTIATLAFTASASAQIKSSTPRAHPRTPSQAAVTPAVLIPPESAFTTLSELNTAKRFVAPLFGPVQLKDMQQEHCFGVKVARGRILIESSGEYYGIEFSQTGEPRMTSIGLVWVEGAVQVGGKIVKPGPYLAFASETTLALFTDDSAGASPSLEPKLKLVLRAPLPSAQLEKKATERPRINVFVEAGKGFVSIGENRFPVM